MRVKISNERSDLKDLVSAAIKATYDTRKPGGVERCIDVLKQLKSLSLPVKDILLSESIFKLETLKRHRRPKICKEAQSLFDSWSKTFYYAQGRRDNSFKAALIKIRLKLKKPVLTPSYSELKRKDNIHQRSTTREAQGIKKMKKKDFVELNKKEDPRSLTRETEKIQKVAHFVELKKKEEQRSLNCETKKIKKEAKIDVLELKKKEEPRVLTHEAEEIKKKTKIELKKKKDDRSLMTREGIKKETKTDVKPLNLKRRGDAFEALPTKKPRGEAVEVAGNQNMCSVTSIRETNRQVTTKTLIPPPRRRRC